MARSRDEEIAAQCGAPTPLASGTYEIWLEEPGFITPYRAAIAGSGEREHVLPLVAAGRVLARRPAAAATSELWHLESHEMSGALARSFRRKSAKRDEVVQLPAGHAIAVALGDRGQALAVSRPLVVTAGATTELDATPPSRGAYLYVILERPADVRSASGDIGLLAGQAGHARPPDAFLNAADCVVGVWYDMPPGRTEMTLQSATMRLPAESVVLREREVATVRGAILRLPRLGVTLDVPAGAVGKEPLSLQITQRDGQTVRKLEALAIGSFEVESLPATPLLVTLRLGHWRFDTDVDLTSGSDDTVRFEVRPIVITGVVTYGGKPVRANVAFSADEIIAADTDDDGRYRITLWHERRYGLHVQLRDHPEVPTFLDTVRFSGSQDFDIAIPFARYSVRAVDSGTRQGVANANVTLTNDWEDPAQGSRRVMSHVVTGSDGRSGLPPIRDGMLELRVDAEGYEPATLPRQPVSAGPDGVILEVALHPLDAPVSLRIVLPDGSPAVGAQLFAVSPSDQVLYSATADGEGQVRLSGSMPDALLVVRHPQAAAGVRGWSAGMGRDAVLTLDRAAAQPLTLRVTGADGEPAGGFPVYLWVSGYRLGGIALALLAQDTTTALDGTWTVRSLPAGPISVLVVGRSRAAGVTSGAFDTLAQTIPYPWPLIVDVHAQ